MSTMIPTLTALAHASSTVSSATPSCPTAVPDKYGYVPPDSCNANYGFYLNWEDNTAFAVAFGLSTKFCWVIVIGASWECICFIARALGARDQQEAAYVIVSTLLFLLAPIWINAFIYMIVARLVHFAIVVRVIFRLVEFGGGANSNNVVLRHEEFQLYLGALSMLITLVLLNVVHAGQVLKGARANFPSAKVKWWHGQSVAFETLELSSTHRSG
ncbi:RTA1 domain containing protein [Fusarium agapanthi]|uniref:RTA1 domain containing protein n=1 Tax=Fusarium agapanthi TaxID=1803897 RepID=A0A9P5EGE4_9HYPO|nr:RTA1 domain containing protein [Fusarium agapanthi]